MCPRLCRSACPVALGSGREAAVPAVMASILLRVERGEVDPSLAIEVATLCTDCGGCQEHCHIDRDLPAALRAWRGRQPMPAIDPLLPITGKGRIVVVEADERRWAAAFSELVGEPVRTLRTRDGLGVAAVEHEGFRPRLDRLRSALDGLEVVVSSGGVAEVLAAADVPFVWLRDRVPQLPGGAGSCRRPGRRPIACCGAAGPLSRHHPEDAKRVGRLWLDRAHDWMVEDARCRNHLRGCGAEVVDPVDALLAGDVVR